MKHLEIMPILEASEMISVNERQKKTDSNSLLSAFCFVGRFACQTPCGSKLFTFHDVMSAVANYSLFTLHFSLKTARSPCIATPHSVPLGQRTRGAQCRDDRGDDAADDLEDGLPRFLFHGVRWFLSGLINFSSLSL